MIIRKNTTELTLRSSKEPLATVEVDLDSIPEERCGYGDIVADGLTSWAANNSDETATIYVYESPSVNFREPTNSAFFGVVGKKAVLDGVMTALKRVPKVRVRPSDSILARSASATFHIEGGAVWQVDDEITWFAHQPEPYRKTWLRYARHWVQKTDPNGHLQMPGSRTMRSPLDGKRWYFANKPGPAVPDGLNDEEAIRALWTEDSAK